MLRGFFVGAAEEEDFAKETDVAEDAATGKPASPLAGLFQQEGKPSGPTQFGRIFRPDEVHSFLLFGRRLDRVFFLFDDGGKGRRRWFDAVVPFRSGRRQLTIDQDANNQYADACRRERPPGGQGLIGLCRRGRFFST